MEEKEDITEEEMMKVIESIKSAENVFDTLVNSIKDTEVSNAEVFYACSMIICNILAGKPVKDRVELVKRIPAIYLTLTEMCEQSKAMEDLEALTGMKFTFNENDN